MSSVVRKRLWSGFLLCGGRFCGDLVLLLRFGLDPLSNHTFVGSLTGEMKGLLIPAPRRCVPTLRGPRRGNEGISLSGVPVGRVRAEMKSCLGVLVNWDSVDRGSLLGCVSSEAVVDELGCRAPAIFVGGER